MQIYGQKTSKMPQKWGIPPFVTPKIFLKIGLCHFCTLMVPYLHAKKLEKTNEQSLRNSKMDTQYAHTHGQGRLLRTPLSKPWVQNDQWTLQVYSKKSSPSGWPLKNWPRNVRYSLHVFAKILDICNHVSFTSAKSV